ncbi:hypothetical protein CPB84DRAFT_1754730 [Gymnopilus junonius]|uniref:Uncharacterized protein n=1 Tax=Gymnopilus junonius TaxID=109634 RepID=A0A9P5N7M5_GYMJU|nr:hypothetical protein CPB84DRAFT_1754730 [Gymnopilus junonius]
MEASNSIAHAVKTFIQDITILPINKPIDNILENALVAEHEIRLLFGSDLYNPQLQDLYLGLIDIFSLHPATRRTHSRNVQPNTPEYSNNYIFPVIVPSRRLDLMPSTVFSIEVFRRHWDVFTHGALSKMKEKDWENVVAAGGSILACLMAPYPKVDSAKSLNEYYQSAVYGSCDIDLFLWGLSTKQAEAKMIDIYQAVCAAAPWYVTCIRKANTVSIHSRQVWVNPRSLAALIHQANTIDIYDRDLHVLPKGLAHLLAHEAIYNNHHHYHHLRFLNERNPNPPPIAKDGDVVDQCRNNYDNDVEWAVIPYGKHWDADLWINSKYYLPNIENEFIPHRHVFFAGTMQQCLGTFCPDCDPSKDTADSSYGPGSGIYIKGPINLSISETGPKKPTNVPQIRMNRCLVGLNQNLQFGMGEPSLMFKLITSGAQAKKFFGMSNRSPGTPPRRDLRVIV